jgi:hypothetical protein
MRLIYLTATRCPILAIQSDIKDASAKLLQQLGLQTQAFAHPRLHSAVMVTDRQDAGCSLRTEQDVARMKHGD